MWKRAISSVQRATVRKWEGSGVPRRSRRGRAAVFFSGGNSREVVVDPFGQSRRRRVHQRQQERRVRPVVAVARGRHLVARFHQDADVRRLRVARLSLYSIDNRRLFCFRTRQDNVGGEVFAKARIHDYTRERDPLDGIWCRERRAL